MYFLDPAKYLDTKLVKQGRKQLGPTFEELANWIFDEFGTKPLNIYYDKIETDNGRPRLNIVFEYYDSHLEFREKNGSFDSAKQKVIADKFRQILRDKLGQRYGNDRLFVTFDAFDRGAVEEANHKIPKEAIDNLKVELRSQHVWEIYREFDLTVYFFYTDRQIEKAKRDGTTKLMESQYCSLLKKYDEFDYINPETFSLEFDSKENFDKRYEGNWFCYSRR